MSLFGKIFSPTRVFEQRVREINNLEEHCAQMSDEQLRTTSDELKRAVRDGERTLEEVCIEAFALVREAAKRTLKQRHFDVQLLGGMIIADGAIAEMATGEGKTLAATAPAYLHGLTGKGVHIITVNDYLAQRDAVWMGQIYHFLGLSVGCLVHEQAFLYDPQYTQKNQDEKAKQQNEKAGGGESELDRMRDTAGAFKVVHEFLRPAARKEAYGTDVVYGTNHEFGFDYLRDNLAYATAQQVQRPHYFAIIDEVDSILIDEARTPLIISAPDTQAAQYYKLFARLATGLSKDTDYIVDEKARAVQITDEGIEKVEKALSIDNLYSPQYIRLAHYLEESLKAKALFLHDRHYVVKNGEIIIVDEFTGRLMHGRRYSGGLHQALEAKEGVRVQEESRTFAQITIQNYFRLYEKMSGMTGTAKTSSEEFAKVYGLDVVVVPTNKPCVRKDYPDFIYKTRDARYEALVGEVKRRQEAGEPVLVGTTSIDENETLSELFVKAGVRHEVLNAKNHEREGEIIAQAGRAGAVMLATNMAGRGVDIVLGGNPPDETAAQAVKEKGGLFVLGTQRHEARRIDNQLRGRSGRQGDPGESRFFLSLEDDLLRIFGGEKVKSLMTRLNLPEDEPIESSMVARVVDEAQKKVEGINFDARRHLLEYDTVLNKQRQTVYRRRQGILERVEKGETAAVLEEVTKSVVVHGVGGMQKVPETPGQDKNPRTAFEEWMRSLGVLENSRSLSDEDMQMFENGELPAWLKERVTLAAAQADAGFRLIGALDMLWTAHLENLEALLEAVRVRAYGQKDPLVEYKREGFEMFRDLMASAEALAVSAIFQSLEQKGKTAQGATAKEVVQAAPVIMPSGDDRAGQKKIGRNDPCWCGSGKKYKKCHGA